MHEGNFTQNQLHLRNLTMCFQEVEVYIANIKSLYGEFNYAPFKMQYDPENELKQLLLFIPRYKPNSLPPKKRFKSFEIKAKVKKEGSEEIEGKEAENDNVEENTGTEDNEKKGENDKKEEVEKEQEKEEVIEGT